MRWLNWLLSYVVLRWLESMKPVDQNAGHAVIPSFLGNSLAQKVVKVEYYLHFSEILCKLTGFQLDRKHNFNSAPKNYLKNIVELGSIFWGWFKCILGQSMAKKIV